MTYSLTTGCSKHDKLLFAPVQSMNRLGDSSRWILLKFNIDKIKFSKLIVF